MQLILSQHDLKVVADFLKTDEASAQDFAHFFEWSELGKGHALAHHSRRQIADDLVDQIRMKERSGQGCTGFDMQLIDSSRPI